MEQIIMNLCVNARDAMQKGGELTIETRNVHLDAEHCQHHVDAREGDYVLLSVSDTGTGIPEEAYEHIFEPFFTTKGVGKGTGLGLATVYAIVKRHGGFIDFSSGGGRGATFRIYLPVFEGAEETPETGSKGYQVTPLGHGNTLLFAEDDEQVRRLTTGMLERAGYRVLSARDGEEAIVVFEQHANEIDLALLDVVMPKRTGLDVLDVIRRSRPEIPVLFSSGYSGDVLGADLTERKDFELIRKPFQQGDLLNRIGRLIERKPSPP
jgi:CheY-like chemotaxis protein